jgi:hypothetical protein
MFVKYESSGERRLQASSLSAIHARTDQSFLHPSDIQKCPDLLLKPFFLSPAPLFIDRILLKSDHPVVLFWNNEIIHQDRVRLQVKNVSGKGVNGVNLSDCFQ